MDCCPLCAPSMQPLASFSASVAASSSTIRSSSRRTSVCISRGCNEPCSNSMKHSDFYSGYDRSSNKYYDFRSRWGRLYNSYKPGKMYWELVITVRCCVPLLRDLNPRCPHPLRPNPASPVSFSSRSSRSCSGRRHRTSLRWRCSVSDLPSPWRWGWIFRPSSELPSFSSARYPSAFRLLRPAHAAPSVHVTRGQGKVGGVLLKLNGPVGLAACHPAAASRP